MKKFLNTVYRKFKSFIRYKIYLKIFWFSQDMFRYFFKYGLLKDAIFKFLGKNPYYADKQVINYNDAKNNVEKLLKNRHEKKIEQFVIRDSKAYEDKNAWGIEFEIIDLEVGLGYKDYYIVDKETAEIIPTDYICENGLELLKEYALKKKRSKKQS